MGDSEESGEIAREFLGVRAVDSMLSPLRPVLVWANSFPSFDINSHLYS